MRTALLVMTNFSGWGATWDTVFETFNRTDNDLDSTVNNEELRTRLGLTLEKLFH